MERRLIEPLFFIAVLIGTVVVAFLMFRPFLYTLIFAAVLAYLTSGVYQRMLRYIHSPSWSALLMLVLVLATLLIPFTLIGLRIVYEATNLYTSIATHATQAWIAHAASSVQQSLDRAAPGIRINAAMVTEQLNTVLNWFIAGIGPFLNSFVRLLIHALLLLVFYFYFVRDGFRFTERLKYLSPLPSDQEDMILNKIGIALTSTVRGSLLMAILQGLVTGAGFIVFGVPNPALWGTVTVFAAFVPMVGTSTVIVPSILFLGFTGHVPQAIGFTIWSIVFNGTLDNVVGPRLMARGSRLNPLIMLLAILGGVSFYGPLGILLGPITIALLYALLEIYLSVVRAPQPVRPSSKK